MLKKTSLIFSKLVPLLIDPLFCALFKTGVFFVNNETTKYSVVKISNEYFPYSEGIMNKFPGYKLDVNHLIMNKVDEEINLTELK
jgi:hypothetical protein